MKKKLTAKQIISFCEETIAFEKKRIKNSLKTIAKCKETLARTKAVQKGKVYKKKK
ncbi:hypothetical protein ACFL7E_07440 [Thermodesulfobacteriota bacterium]